MECPFLWLQADTDFTARSGLWSRPQKGSAIDAQDGADGHLPQAQNQPAASRAPDLSLSAAGFARGSPLSGLVQRHQCAMTAWQEVTPAKPAVFRPAIAILPRPVKEAGRKGAVKLGRVTTAGLNKQSGLNCTGCGPSPAGRASKGSMAR